MQTGKIHAVSNSRRQSPDDPYVRKSINVISRTSSKIVFEKLSRQIYFSAKRYKVPRQILHRIYCNCAANVVKLDSITRAARTDDKCCARYMQRVFAYYVYLLMVRVYELLNYFIRVMVIGDCFFFQAFQVIRC